MTADKMEIAHRLQALQSDFSRQLPERLALVESAWLAAQNGDADALDAMHRQIHGLAGSGATFGFADLSATARVLELALAALPAGMPGKEQREHIDVLLNKVRDAAGALPEGVSMGLGGVSSSAARSASSHENRLVYLAEDDPELSRLLAIQISHFGYQVRTFPDPDALCKALHDSLPAAVIMDISFPGGERAGTEAMLLLRQQGVALPPLLFISSRRDFNTRLDAVRAGGEAYFTKPVEIGELVDRLDVLTASTQPEPFRVMIVEDTSLLAAVYAHILEQAGMITCQVTNPMDVMASLADFSPELILMDMYMPGASGEEVAKVLRQQEALVGVPIVFLSGETDLGRQLAAIGHGADDFLVKPIQPEHLLLSITSRIERYRVLRSFMVRDSLTGLLNHTKTKEQLEVEIERAKRQQRPLSFAMIDLDHFKRVNDTYGHPTGDKVLKSLARLLQQRLRKVDVIGRYGGEEFAVILTDTTGPDAVRVLDDIRKDLAQIQQHGEDGEFSVTFSCGIASYPDFSTPEAISNAADKALYQAKHGGRNRVVLAALHNPRGH